MNIKRLFGALLTILGTISLIYGAVLFVNNTNTNHNVKALIVYSTLGLLFFIAGISLVRVTKDEA